MPHLLVCAMMKCAGICVIHLFLKEFTLIRNLFFSRGRQHERDEARRGKGRVGEGGARSAECE